MSGPQRGTVQDRIERHRPNLRIEIKISNSTGYRIRAGAAGWKAGFYQPCYRYELMTFLVKKLNFDVPLLGSLIWSRTLTELIFNPCGEFP